MEPYETIVVGGGPAGLSAALHLAWHNRRVLVIDRVSGPLFFTLEELFNVPGMPAVRGLDLQKKLRAQAEEMGAEVVRGNVVAARREGGYFHLEGDKDETWTAQTLLLATGVARYHPTVDGDYRPCFKYAGKGNLFYCPDCEAPSIAGQHTVVIGVGPGDWATGMAVGLSRYTDRLEVLATGDPPPSEGSRQKLEERGIRLREGSIRKLVGERSRLQAVELEDGTRIEADAFFVSSPTVGRTDLAQQLGVEMAATGNHAQPKSQRGDTNVPGVWIAGDLRPMTQQVSVAFGTGNLAAVMIDQALRKQDVSRG